MAGVTYTFATTVKIPGLATLPADQTISVIGDYGVEVEIDVPAGQVSLHVPVASIDKTKLVACCINADKAAMNVFTNSADGTGGQSFVLTKNQSVAWNNQINQTLYPNPITTNITAFYVNNPGTVAGIFRAGFLAVV